MRKNNTFSSKAEENIDEAFVSKCMYCGSTAYGTGCIYSTHNRHIHSDDPSRCIYCGSLSYGSGCIYNPHNNMHIHGVDVSTSIKETARKTVELSYITDRLLDDTLNSEAYKLGLVDESGKQIRVPHNIHECNLVSPLSKALFHLRRFIPAQADMIRNSLSILSESENNNTSCTEESVEEYETALLLKKDVNYFVQGLVHTLRENYSKLPLEKIEKIIEDAILDNT
jgi:hypothetical protein